MSDERSRGPVVTNPWPLVLCLVGVDYFSTLAYLPSIAVAAAGPLAPVAAAGVVLVTFGLALPVYWYVVGRSPDGRGATGIFEDRVPGWRGKLIVLTLLGFAAADFVITRSLSLADAAIHLIDNPHGQRLFERLPKGMFGDTDRWWAPLASTAHYLGDRQVVITLGLSIVSFGLWQFFKNGMSRRMLRLTAVAVAGYLLVTGIVIGSGVVYLVRHPALLHAWRDAILLVGEPTTTSAATSAAPAPDYAWLRAWLGVGLWTFPQMALGLTGFEMIMTVTPAVSGGRQGAGSRAGRVRNTRKLMVAAASIMAVYLVSAVTITTLLVPPAALMPGGSAEHRALAYVAHGSTLVGEATASDVNPLFGHKFGDLFDLSTALVLCLAGASVTMGLQNLLPHYLSRLGMEISWAGRVGVIMHLLNAIVLLITVVFRASPSSQQWAYTTSVLVLLAGGALATAKDLHHRHSPGLARRVLVLLPVVAGGFFLTMTGLTVLVNHSGLTIALAFVSAILISSFFSRWIRSTELRFEGFDFANDAAARRWLELCGSGAKVLVPHRPGLVSLAEKRQLLERDYRLAPGTAVIFIEAVLGDPSNFYQRPLVKIEREGDLEVIRASKCVSVSHVLAAICLELCRDGGEPPEVIFGWSNESPLAANLNFLLSGEGNIPWMVRELVRKANADAARQPRILIG